MKRLCAVILCCLACLARAQEDFAPAEIVQGATDWLKENVDDRVLDALGVDEPRVRRFLADIQKQFDGVYVYDLGAWRDTARQIYPVLASYEETAPYADWLHAHIDYFDVAETLRTNAAPKDTNVVRLPPPSPVTERSVWVQVMEKRPTPPAANKHLPRLKQIFAEERVPAELVWIAEVESSFNAKARSPAGAAGMFQLMPATARDYDLSVNVLRDERYNPEKSARAAAQHLRRLFLRFHDWRLAFAAYNVGEGRVSELLKKYKARSFDEIAQHLPSETQLYVPKLEATLRKREGITLAQLKSPAG